MNGGLRPDIWTLTPDNVKIGNWEETKKHSPSSRREDRLRQELLRMVQDDQALRRQLVGTNKPDAELLKKLETTDRKNTTRLKGIVDKHGWPGKSLVGEDGANAAWLLVQHADRDSDFQKRCLRLLKDAVRNGEASASDLAYLTDRVLVADKKKQLYGTQFTMKNGELVPHPIEDEEHIDQRRKHVGLGPLAEYRKQLKTLYQSPPSKK
jgi:hypothetical protein